jgi:hypothetical protein
VISFVDAYFKAETLTARTVRLAYPRLRRVGRSLKRREAQRDPLLRIERVAHADAAGVTPLPFGVIPTAVSAATKKLDVTFLGYPNTSERVKIIEELEVLKREGHAVATTSLDSPEPLAWPDYFETLASSAIGLAARGRGHNTLKYWEIPYAGALLVTPPSQIVIPHDFVDGVDAVFAPAPELVRRARTLLESRERVVEMAERGRERVTAHHLSVHRAEAVVSALENSRASAHAKRVL